jgi:hypothetical protein
MEPITVESSPKVDTPIKDRIVWGGVYKYNALLKDWVQKTSVCSEDNYFTWGNDQKYGLFVPVFDGEKYWMIDTYEMGFDPSCFFNSENSEGRDDKRTKIQRYIDGLKSLADPKRGKWQSRSVFDYFYNNRVEITQESLNCFDLYCDLNECEIISPRDACKYESEDIYEGVKLYQEHAYPDGITLHRLGGAIDWAKRISCFVRDDLRFREPKAAYDSDLQQLKQFIVESNGDYDHVLVERVLAKNAFVQKQQEEYEEFERQLDEKYATCSSDNK